MFLIAWIGAAVVYLFSALMIVSISWSRCHAERIQACILKKCDINVDAMFDLIFSHYNETHKQNSYNNC